MLVAQITDTHLGFTERSRGNIQRLERVIVAVAEHDPALVLVTGDLTENGDPEAYRLLRRMLHPFAGRVLLTVGNHDRRDAFFEAFGDVSPQASFAQTADERGPLRVIMLDTLDEGWETAGFCAERAAWLDASLNRQAGQPTLIALHHPPARTGVDWIDVNADGRWSGRLKAVVSRHQQVVGLVAGHVHQPVTTSFAGRPLLIAPPVAFPVAYDITPIDPGVPDGRALIVARPPGFALHRWTGENLVSYFGIADDAPPVALFDRDTQALVTQMFAEAATHDI